MSTLALSLKAQAMSSEAEMSSASSFKSAVSLQSEDLAMRMRTRMKALCRQRDADQASKPAKIHLGISAFTYDLFISIVWIIRT
jgi:hypothetical protein